jgi:uncharacterized protein (TIGR02246 family)
MRAFTFATLAAIIAATACAPPAAQQSPELAAMTERWEEALNSGKVEAVAALYSDDARLLPPNAELAQGRAAVAAEFAAMVAAGLTIDLENVDAVVAGDVGYKVGTYTLLAPGGVTVDRGKYIDVWRKVDGEWKITNDIWNSNLPVSAGGTTVVITHEVEDADRWLNAFRGEDSRRELFAEHAGASTVRTFQNPETPNLTALVLDVSDMSAFETFLQSEAAATAKAEDGVKDATMRIFLEVK